MSEQRYNADQAASPLGASPRDHTYYQQLKQKLRWQLLVGYVTPLLLLSAYFHYQYNTTLRSGVDTHLRSIAENRRNTVDLFLQERIVNLQNTFRADALPIPPPAGAMEGALRALQADSASFVDLGLFNPQGTQVAYAGPHAALRGRDYSGETWYRDIRNSDSGHLISDVYLGFRGQPHFIVAVRRADAEGDWVLRASVDPREFAAFVASSHVLEEAEAFIVNRAGQRQTLQADEAAQPPTVPLAVGAADTEVSEVRDGEVRYLRALAWLSIHDWALVVQVPAAKAYAPLRRARVVVIGLMLVALAFIVLMVLRSTRLLVGRLERARRTREQLTTQLFNAAKLASVGEMAAGVAHEINNPLAIVYEEASMMKDLLDPQFAQRFDIDEFRERLGAICEATMRGREITRKLLAFARQHDPEPELTDVNQVVRRVVKVKETDLKVSNIALELDLAENPPPVLLGRNQLDQVLLNLLNNARDAIQHDGRISVRTRATDRRVEIDVQDSGCGMSSEVLEKVFFPFFTTKAVGRGTGLGLSISYGIIKTLGGSIEVESEPDQGTTFTIALPVGSARSRAAEETSDAA